MEINSPQRYNWLIWRGNTRTIRIELPIDLTGYTATLSYGPESNMITRAMTLAAVDAPYWSVSTTFTPNETKAFIKGKSYPYEIQLKSSGGEEYTYLEGELVASGGTNV